MQFPSGENQKMDIKAQMALSTDIVYRPGAGVRYDVIRQNQNVERRMRMQYVQIGDVVILKFPWFFYDADDFYILSGKIRKGKALIVDLRGNPGGAVDTLKYFIGMFFDHDVKLYDKVERKKTSPEIAKRERPIYFPGKSPFWWIADPPRPPVFARVHPTRKARHRDRGSHLGKRQWKPPAFILGELWCGLWCGGHIRRPDHDRRQEP